MKCCSMLSQIMSARPRANGIENYHLYEWTKKTKQTTCWSARSRAIRLATRRYLSTAAFAGGAGGAERGTGGRWDARHYDLGRGTTSRPAPVGSYSPPAPSGRRRCRSRRDGCDAGQPSGDIALAARHALPAIYSNREYVAAGSANDSTVSEVQAAARGTGPQIVRTGGGAHLGLCCCRHFQGGSKIPAHIPRFCASASASSSP